jgi:hypothetical protein
VASTTPFKSLSERDEWGLMRRWRMRERRAPTSGRGTTLVRGEGRRDPPTVDPLLHASNDGFIQFMGEVSGTHHEDAIVGLRGGSIEFDDEELVVGRPYRWVQKSLTKE